jgi:hypothetical protein
VRKRELAYGGAQGVKQYYILAEKKTTLKNPFSLFAFCCVAIDKKVNAE